jgi:hypothetical protein
MTPCRRRFSGQLSREIACETNETKETEDPRMTCSDAGACSFIYGEELNGFSKLLCVTNAVIDTKFYIFLNISCDQSRYFLIFIYFCMVLML